MHAPGQHRPAFEWGEHKQAQGLHGYRRGATSRRSSEAAIPGHGLRSNAEGTRHGPTPGNKTAGASDLFNRHLIDLRVGCASAAARQPWSSPQ
jgi:hypothetical protein